ncbi:MAG TPA: hypothetical protein VFU43_13595 [Streptosporangiaceae bacterium]|nr:hypothetical protein [Streptosporangiaceae bacterium]
MSRWRSCSVVVGLAVAALGVTGCGGDGDKAEGAAPSDRPAASAATSAPPPTFDIEHVRKSLLPPKEVAGDVKPQAPTFPGLTEAGAPGCSASTFSLPDRPKTIGRQLETSKRGFTGTHYIQLVAVYPDAAGAAAGMDRLRAKAKACPAKKHFPGKRLGERRFSIEHTDTWTLTEDTIAGWTHVRGFEKHVEPPRTSRFNVFYDVYDYAVRGNVVIATLYWERVKPTTPGERIADKATTVLTKQLQKIG